VLSTPGLPPVALIATACSSPAPSETSPTTSGADGSIIDREPSSVDPSEYDDRDGRVWDQRPCGEMDPGSDDDREPIVERAGDPMATRAVVDDFLAQRHLALVGASRDPKAFSTNVARELRGHGYTVDPVNPDADEIDGQRCFRTVGDLPADVGGAIVMVSADRAADAVRSCLDAGIARIWLHRGVGPSSVSTEAVELCHEHGVPVVDGECPLMFAEPAAAVHRIHRFERKLTGRLPI
jgi:predicted CoA-binding protein